MTDVLPDRETRQHRSMPDLAYEILIEEIFERRLAPGDRLGIDAAAHQLGMSTTPVREALTRLANQGVLVQTTNKGFAVAPLLTPAEFHELFTARRVLEMEALRARPDGTGASARVLDPELVPDEIIRRLVDLTRAMKDADHSPGYAHYARFTRLDNAFHQTLVDLSGNRFLRQAWRGLNFHLHISRLYAGAGIIDWEVACAEHDLILASVRHRDGPGLGTQATEHILNAEQRLVRLVTLDPPDPADRNGT